MIPESVYSAVPAVDLKDDVVNAYGPSSIPTCLLKNHAIKLHKHIFPWERQLATWFSTSQILYKSYFLLAKTLNLICADVRFWPI